MFESSETRQEWDGSVNQGKARAGTYFYVLKWGEQEWTGSLTLSK
ncbi:gliding motility-associated C-terminal domain-containing protein [bacterium SCSIO 12741]|nr:gliding motility-associated C-terminal domain-containing protein [bacterium SCSIO 12741]